MVETLSQRITFLSEAPEGVLTFAEVMRSGEKVQRPHRCILPGSSVIEKI
jgi:hypothetical protein